MLKLLHYCVSTCDFSTLHSSLIFAAFKYVWLLIICVWLLIFSKLADVLWGKSFFNEVFSVKLILKVQVLLEDVVALNTKSLSRHLFSTEQILVNLCVSFVVVDTINKGREMHYNFSFWCWQCQTINCKKDIGKTTAIRVGSSPLFTIPTWSCPLLTTASSRIWIMLW